MGVYFGTSPVKLSAVSGETLVRREGWITNPKTEVILHLVYLINSNNQGLTNQRATFIYTGSTILGLFIVLMQAHFESARQRFHPCASLGSEYANCYVPAIPAAELEIV